MNELAKEQEDQRQAILNMEAALLSLPQIELNAKHYLCKGLYTRELFMPKGSAVTGKIHVKEHIVTIVYGDVSVATNDGVERIVGPCTFIGKAGSKRALFMHEDTLWLATHATDATTVEECENTLVTNSHEEYLRLLEGSTCHSGLLEQQ
jgi:hypothetical protein